MDMLARTREILGKLVAFPTVSSDSNLELIAYAADLLSDAGATLLLSRDDSGTKANLFATLGPAGNGGIVLSGHTDVVPADPSEWTSDPFTLTERGGRLYGRGTCDMKGFIAAALAMAPRFAELDLARPLHFALTYDEEIGCFGARALVGEIANAGIRPSVAIIGEPTGMGVIEGHKGCYEYTTEFIGLEGHGSQPGKGVNAVEYATRYVSRLLDLGERLKARAPAGSRFDPPWTTVQVGRMVGGTARNVIAGACTVEWEMRPVTADDASFVKRDLDDYVDTVLLPAMRAVSPDCGIVTHVIGEVEGLQVVAESKAREIVCKLTGCDHADVVPFGTEAGLFQSAGISSIICGPGSIAQAHKPDEFIAIDQLASCLEMLDKLRLKLAR
ncbi:acetylornithine deacetylase [Chelativorans sp. J32]|uniref:acetylornithine deacetylase n=1 Tax=Chelativorans sp. J32 TaxID=935840 RepID=UPI0004854998|nr:acetylornithine deacetylase [Chelativorans sp. J32]